MDNVGSGPGALTRASSVLKKPRKNYLWSFGKAEMKNFREDTKWQIETSMEATKYFLMPLFAMSGEMFVFLKSKNGRKG